MNYLLYSLSFFGEIFISASCVGCGRMIWGLLTVYKNLDLMYFPKVFVSVVHLVFDSYGDLIMLNIFQHKKAADSILGGNNSRGPVSEGAGSPKYSERLSPAINNYLSEASRQEVRVSC